MLLSLLILVPVALAADPTPDGDRVMISVNGDLDVPAGQEVGTVLIVNGTATIAGTVENVVAINGEAILTGATAETVGRTGVEMEALAAASAGLLTIYDMCKAVDRGMRITDIRLTHKAGGKSGTYRAD